MSIFHLLINKIWIYKEDASYSVHIEEKIKDYTKNHLMHSLHSNFFQKLAVNSTVSMLQKWDAPKNKSQLTSSSIQGGGFKPLSPPPPP
jgi:hypothetical protein